MAKTSIWMPLYIGDYMADTMHLTCEQHGAYMLLMMAYWRKGGPLPANDAALASICRMSPDAWSIAKAVLEEFFDTSTEGLWIHGRIEKELAESAGKKEKAEERAKKAAEARWNKHGGCNKDATSIAQAKLDECPSPSPSPSPDLSGDKSLKTQTPEAPAKTPDEPPPEKPKPAKYKFEPEHLDLASRMAEPVQRRYPSQRINLDEWANAIRKLIELDGRKESEIMPLWIWVTNHDKPGFSWADSCRTPMKLREFDKQGTPYWDVIQQQRQRDMGLIRGSPKPAGVHQFDKIDYSVGVNPDGSF